MVVPFQDYKQPITPFQDHKVQIVLTSQDHLTTTDVIDMTALKHAFPTGFDTTGKMPGEYTICVDSLIPLVLHTDRKVPIEPKEEIEKALQ